MPSNCIQFDSLPAQKLTGVTLIQDVHIVDLLNSQGTGPAGLRILDVDGDGRNEFFIGSGATMLIPGVDGIYQVIVKAAKYAGAGRVGVYTIEALGNGGLVVDTAKNVVAQEKIPETLILASSSENPIRSIIIRGTEVAVWEVCFIFE